MTMKRSDGGGRIKKRGVETEGRAAGSPSTAAQRGESQPETAEACRGSSKQVKMHIHWIVLRTIAHTLSLQLCVSASISLYLHSHCLPRLKVASPP